MARMECDLCKKVIDLEKIVRINFTFKEPEHLEFGKKQQMDTERFVCIECAKEVLQLINGRPEKKETMAKHMDFELGDVDGMSD